MSWGTEAFTACGNRKGVLEKGTTEDRFFSVFPSGSPTSRVTCPSRTHPGGGGPE